MRSKRGTRAVAAIALVGATALTMTACGARSDDGGGSSTGGSGGLTVGSVLFGSDLYQLRHATEMEDAGKQDGVKVVTINPDADVAKQVAGVQDLISKKVDGVIMQPVAQGPLAPAIKALQKADIPVVTWATGETPGVTVPYVALDNSAETFKIGEKAAQTMQKVQPGKPLGIVYFDVPNNPVCQLRSKGFVEGVKSVDPSAEVVAAPDATKAGNLRLGARNAMNDVIQSGRAFNLVGACNDDMTLGALGALKSAGRGKAVDGVPQTEYVYAVDGSPEAISEYLDPNSALKSALMMRPVENTRYLMDTLLKVRDGKLPQDFVGKMTSASVPPDCEGANALLEKEYGKSVKCPT